LYNIFIFYFEKIILRNKKFIIIIKNYFYSFELIISSLMMDTLSQNIIEIFHKSTNKNLALDLCQKIFLKLNIKLDFFSKVFTC